MISLPSYPSLAVVPPVMFSEAGDHSLDYRDKFVLCPTVVEMLAVHFLYQLE